MADDPTLPEKDDEKPVEEETQEAPAKDDIDEIIDAADADDPELVEALELGEGKRPPNRIPYDKVRTIIANARKKEREAYEREIAPKLTETEQRLQRIADAIRNDPDSFLAEAAQLNPRYRELLDGAKAKPTSAPEDPMPEPNYPIRDAQGNITGRTYDVAGIKALQEWSARQVERRVTAEIDKRVNPLIQRSAQSERAAAIQAQLDDARKNWPGFAEHEAAMAEAINASGHRLSLDAAYRQVVVPKLVEITRKRLMEELNGKPKSTSASSAGKKPAKPSENETLEERMARIYDRLEERGQGL